MRLYEVVKNSLYLRLRYMHVTYHFEKSPGLKIDLIHLGVSWRQEENTWWTNQNCKVPVWLQSGMVVIPEENPSTLTSSIFYSFLEDLVKSEKEFITVPTFYSEILVLQGKVSIQYPYNQVSQFRHIVNYDIRCVDKCLQWVTFVRCCFSLLLYLPVGSFVRYPCLLLNISSFSVRQNVRTMLVLSSTFHCLSVCSFNNV